MKSIIFICNTHFQLLIAVMMKLTQFNKYNVDVIITDKMNKSENLYKRLESVSIFRKVFYITVHKELDFKDKKFYRFALELRPSSYKNLDYFKFGCYDEIFLNNPDIFSELVYHKLAKMNNKIKVSLFDEGVSTYTKRYEKNLKGSKKIRLIREFVNFISKRKYIADLAKDLYLLDPELICWDFPGTIHEIARPNFKDDKIISIINTVFGFDKKENDFNFNYIFFEESYFLEGQDIGDLDIVKKISAIVRPENLIVKVHPRNRIDRFKQLGIYTNEKTDIPWEVVALNMEDNVHKTFITISSSSVLSSFLLFNKQHATMMLYLIVNDNVLNSEYVEYFEKFKKKYPTVLNVPNSINELEGFLNELNQTNKICRDEVK